MAAWAGVAVAQPAAAPAETVVGSIGPQPVRSSDLIAADPKAFGQLDDAYQRELRQMQLRYAQARHDLLARELDQLLDRRALEMAAKAQGKTPEALLSTLHVDAVSDADMHAFYEANRNRIPQPYELVAPEIRGHLGTERRETATRSFYARLRKQYDIRSDLPPYRVAVEPAGPARGAASAPVTIVEFGDYQCPYCRQAEATLQTLLANHSGQIRLVFRNFPLSQIHPDADMAAAAAVCADQQGKFWQMHDAMYANQSALALPGLKATAQRLGLNIDRFAACLTDPSTRRALGKDMQAGQDLGIAGTPFFFINGRPVDGSVPLEQFESVIADELQRDPHTPASGT